MPSPATPVSILKKTPRKGSARRVRFSPYVKEPKQTLRGNTIRVLSNYSSVRTTVEEASPSRSSSSEEDDADATTLPPRTGRMRVPIDLFTQDSPSPPTRRRTLIDHMGEAFGQAFTAAVDSVDSVLDMLTTNKNQDVDRRIEVSGPSRIVPAPQKRFIRRDTPYPKRHTKASAARARRSSTDHPVQLKLRFEGNLPHPQVDDG